MRSIWRNSIGIRILWTWHLWSSLRDTSWSGRFEFKWSDLQLGASRGTGSCCSSRCDCWGNYWSWLRVVLESSLISIVSLRWIGSHHILVVRILLLLLLLVLSSILIVEWVGRLGVEMSLRLGLLIIGIEWRVLIRINIRSGFRLLRLIGIWSGIALSAYWWNIRCLSFNLRLKFCRSYI